MYKRHGKKKKGSMLIVKSEKNENVEEKSMSP